MVLANNAIRLGEIQSAITEDNMVLKRHHMSMKQLYRVPFERNSDRLKAQYQYVQHMISSEPPHNFIYMDEAGFNLTRSRRRGRNILGPWATVDVPGQRGGNISMRAAISQHGVISSPSLEALYILIPDDERGQLHDHLPKYVVIWDNVRFHRSNTIRQWFAAHDRMQMEFLPPYSPFLNPIEEFFSAWRWKVYDRHPHTQMTLLAAMDAACDDITADHCRGWIRHSKQIFPRCIAREDIRCDVDENLWPDRLECQDV
ncbi:hypothetical protein IRJ41_013688 [Triplophysa rosa]|uniref:Tc1-like transposase DDE domain-containing protein n=1 Tax=Triplophysa rosa TaxID=992332 RepID=A0A9W7X3N7_TRIRA|nr:hypothetical protein IRJ41_013688 [Triplophysa rosa]